MLLYFVLVFCLIHCGQSEEPRTCSQFYYTDQLLEKMIRSEIKVETMEKGISQTNVDVLGALEDLKREREAFKGDILELKTLLQQDSVAGGWSDWASWSACSITCGGGIRSRSRTCTNPTPSGQGAYCVGDSSEVNTCNGDICPESMLTPNVVFKARTIHNKNPSNGQTLIFTTSTLNYGRGYDISTGLFTVPVNGTYLFSVQVCVYVSHQFTVAIVYDDTIITTGHMYASGDHTCHTFDGMLPLTIGQRVWVKCLYAPNSGDDLYEYSSSTRNQWNSFSGLLVHK